MKKVIICSCLLLWTIWVLNEVIPNANHYSALDWVISIAIYAIPCSILIVFDISTSKQHIKNIETAMSNNGSPKVSSNEPISKNKYTDKRNDNDYLSTVLANGKTIKEQQKIDFMKTQGIYPTNTPRFLDMWIFSNTVPPKENYAVLSNNEESFFYCFHALLLKASLNPASIQLTRLSSGTFNVDYVKLCYVGKINLYQSSPTYAVIKSGSKKATKVFSSNDEAKRYIAGKQNYTIETRCGKTAFYMQYEDNNSTKELWDLTLEQYISYIPYWIRHIKKCLKERSKWFD